MKIEGIVKEIKSGKTKLSGKDLKAYKSEAQRAIKLAKQRKYDASDEVLFDLLTELEQDPLDRGVHSKDIHAALASSYQTALIAFNAATNVVQIAREKGDCNPETLKQMERSRNEIRKYISHPDRSLYSSGLSTGFSSKLSAGVLVGGLFFGSMFVLNGFDNSLIKFSPGEQVFNWNWWIGIALLLVGLVGAHFYSKNK